MSLAGWLRPLTPEPRIRRVLVVDDNRDAARMHALLLETMGCEAQMATKGAVAKVIAQQFRPDIALLDLVLPDTNGCDLAQDLIDQLRAVKVYIVTGHPDDASRHRAREVGCQDYLLKPLDGAMLERLLAG